MVPNTYCGKGVCLLTGIMVSVSEFTQKFKFATIDPQTCDNHKEIFVCWLVEYTYYT